MNQVLNERAWGKVSKDQPMSEYTSFKIGGPVDYLVEPSTSGELKQAVRDLVASDKPWMMMGNGSNMLVSDKGIRGYVVRLRENFSKIEVEGNLLKAQAGALMKEVAEAALEHGLAGLEFAHGIPGTIGGGVTMNAGAYDGETKDVVKSVTAMDREGNLHNFTNEEMHFRYRHSRVQEEGLVIVEVVYELEPGDRNAIEAKMEDLMNRRKSKQPLEMPSAGSTFKRPEGYFAGQLIDQAGLRGVRHDGAQISQKHCGFVVNADHATCQDVVELIRMVQGIVYQVHGVRMETEVKVIGEK